MTTEREAQDRQAADDVYGHMRRVIDTMASVPGEFDLEELAGVVVNAANQEALIRMAKDMLLHKGRQHCGGKIRRPDGEEGVFSDGGRGRFPRAVPVDSRGRSMWVGWAYSDANQRHMAATRRSAQAGGLEVEAERIRAEILTQNAAEQARQIDGPGYDPNTPVRIGPVSLDRNMVHPNDNIPERPWEGGDWIMPPK